MKLSIELGGVSVLSREIRRTVSRIDDLRPALEAVAKMLAEANRKNFDSEGAAGSLGRWAPLSPAYRAWKDVHYPGKPILVRTGKLRDELTKVPLGVQTTTATSLKVGSDIAYGGYHQTGTARMPRRAPIALEETVRRDMVKVIQRFIMTGSTSGTSTR